MRREKLPIFATNPLSPTRDLLFLCIDIQDATLSSINFQPRHLFGESQKTVQEEERINITGAKQECPSRIEDLKETPYPFTLQRA